ncbi:MAG: CHAP domain-containing protein [Acetatifactor sp.]|nr:CHAP domain-containing protein [Acetatifactor sp.]
MAKDIVDVAIGEIGCTEQGSNKTKYGAWYGMNGAAWCHMFVSWCANQAGVKTSVVPKTASCSSGMGWFKNKGLFKYKGKYTPKRGDIIYFCSAGASHVGIVEKVSGDTVHTVEGNTSNKVARRSYPLNAARITGYGVPKYENLNSSNDGSGSSSTTKKNSKKELSYLKKVLKKKAATTDAMDATIAETGKLPACNVQIIVKNSKKRFEVPVKDGMKLVWERKGTPGKLTFEAAYDKNFRITEGNAVLLIVDGTKMFYGFVFSRQRSKDGFYSYTVYDQLRYLKNKDTIIFKKKRADQYIRLIADRFQLKCGKLANSGYVIPKKIEDESTLFDMIQNALDTTLMTKNKVYVLYDEVGKLRLRNISSMKVNNCLIDDETGEDYTYKSSIDSNVYNQIKLIYENSEKGTYDLYVAKSTKSINKWGVLQYLEKISDPDVGKLKSQAYLKLYNKKARYLTISGVIGNKKVRAGSLVPVILNLDDVKVANYMMVEKVTHTFKNRQHSMDLVVSGGDFSGE